MGDAVGYTLCNVIVKGYIVAVICKLQELLDILANYLASKVKKNIL